MPGTPDAERLSELKSVLRSLLVARGNQQVTVHALNRMYMEEETTWIPFREFGYSNVEQFLRSIPDTLTLYYSRNNELCAQHVENEKTRHISSLIARQNKPNAKKAKSSFATYSRNRYIHHHYARPTPRIYLPSLTVIENILENLRYVARKNQRDLGIRKADVLSKIIEHLGRSSNYSISHLTTQLQSMGTKLHIVGDFIYFKEDWAKLQEEKLQEAKHQNRTVYQNHPISSNIRVTVPGYNSSALNHSTKSNHETQDSYYSKPVVSSNLQYTIPNEYQNGPRADSTTQHHTAYNDSYNKTTVSNPVTDRPDISSSSMVNKSNTMNDNGFSTNPHRYAASNNDFRTKDVNANSCQSSTIDSQMQEKSQVYESKKQESEADRQKTKIVQRDQMNSNTDMIKERTKIRLQNLIENHPEGIWAIELPNIYKKEYGLDLEYLDAGFNNISEFVAALPEIFFIEEIDHKHMLLNAKSSRRSSGQRSTAASLYNMNEYISKEQDPIPMKLSTGVSTSLIPEGVMSLDETVEPILVSSLTMSSSDKDYIEIVISEIFTPSFFWINLRGNKKKLEAMMAELGEFYSCKQSQDYKVPQIVLQPGLNVACIYSKIWHRAIVKRIKPDGYVVVLFCDYGTVKTYNPNDLYFLHKKFSLLPAQAIPCGLHHVRPINSNEWLHSVTAKFVRRVWNIPFVAVVASINDENNTMMITLTDTNDDQIDVHINDWMVEEKLAEYGSTPRIPLDKIHKYDEDLLLKLRDEESKARRKSKMNMDIELNDIGQQRNIEYTSPPPSISCIDTFDPSDVFSLIKETKELSQQTNTITQAILLNMPLNKSEAISNSKSVSNEVASLNQYNQEKLSRFETDVNSNSSSKLGLSQYTESAFQPIRNESAGKNYLDSPSDGRSSVFSSVSHQARFDERIQSDNRNNYVDLDQPKKYSNGFPERPPSVTSSYCQSNYEFSKNNMQTELSPNNGRISKMEFDKQSIGGTLYLTKVSSDDNVKNIENAKSLPKFASETSNNTVITNSVSENKLEKVSHQETDDGYSSAARASLIKATSTLSLAPSVAPLNVSAFTAIQLSQRCENKFIHIFHLDEDGWVVTSEVVSAFTNLKDQRIMFKLLKILEYKVNYKNITRETEPELFTQLDQSKLKAPRDENNAIKEDFVLILLPLKTVMQILVKLDFLNSKMVKEAVPLMKQRKENLEEELFELFESKILYDVMNLPRKYAQFKRSLRISKK